MPMLTSRMPDRPRNGGETSGPSSAWDSSGAGVMVVEDGVAAAVARGGVRRGRRRGRRFGRRGERVRARVKEETGRRASGGVGKKAMLGSYGEGGKRTVGEEIGARWWMRRMSFVSMGRGDRGGFGPVRVSLV